MARTLALVLSLLVCTSVFAADPPSLYQRLGAAWDVNQLRGGGLPAVSFTKAFVEIKAREIEEQLELNLV